MTALAGLWNTNGDPSAAQSCRRMLAAQRLYGPHGEALWDDGDVAIGRALFRILPEDAQDRQPVSAANGRFIVIADLRLDNRADLARSLDLEPSEAARAPDSAYLARAWERWETGVFDHLVGDYAFAVWDAAERRLHLARDPMGGRPLHYHRGQDFFGFASMPKGLHALAEVPYLPDEVRAAEFLALLPEYGPSSFFAGISRVEAGQLVTVSAGGIQVAHHWQPRRDPLKLAKADDYAEGLRHHLDQAVEARLRGVGDRVAAHLSAGYDSSAVASSAACLMARQGGEVEAFTAVPRAGYAIDARDRRLGDEGELAAATAALYPNMRHILVRPNGRTVVDDLDRDFFLFERPLVNACNQRWWKTINDEVRARGHKVLLTAVLGNFSISYHGQERLAELTAKGSFLALAREGYGVVRSGRLSLASMLASAFGPWVPQAAWRAAHRMLRGSERDLASYSALSMERRRALDIDGRAAGQDLDFSYRPRKNGFDSRLWALRRVDLGNVNKGALAGWGVDQRDPTTDRRLVEFSLSVPMEAYLSHGETRALAQRAFAGRIPERVLAERRKGVQAIDWHENVSSMPGAVREEIERLVQVPAAATALDLPRMRRLAEEWPEEGWHGPNTDADYRFALMRGLVSGHFLRKASRSNA